VLEARILALGVLPDDDDVHIIVPGGQAGEVEAVDEGGIEVELLAELHVEGGDTPSEWGGEAALEADLVAADGVQHLGGDRGHVAVDLVGLEVDGRVHRLHHLPHGTRDEGPDAVAGDERDAARGAVPRTGHVGDGASGDGAGEERGRGWGRGRGRGQEAPQERSGSPRHDRS
jgi:hypothetical protein